MIATTMNAAQAASPKECRLSSQLLISRSVKDIVPYYMLIRGLHKMH